MSATEATREAASRAYERPGHWLAAFDPRRRNGEGGGGPLALEVLDGSAPKTATDGTRQVIFDGWLYNRGDLAKIGRAAEAADDARLILEAYRERGEGIIARLRGRFAMLIWDGAREELLVVRDPVGSFPLFCADRGDEMLFSTGIGDLLSDPSVPKGLNRLVLAEHLSCRWPQMEDTYYEAVRRIPPGHVVALGRGGRRQSRYWDPVPEPGSDEWLKDDELHLFEGAFDGAVGRCLERGRPGIFLSGGLDSVSVAAVATDLIRSDGMELPLALSLAFPHPNADEREVQERVAAQLGLSQVMLPYDEAVGAAGSIGAVVEANATRAVPVLGLWEAGYWRLGAEGREHGCKVILTGSGGDEMLVPSQMLAADLMARFDLTGLRRLYAELRRSYPWPARDMARETLWVCGLKPLIVRRTRKTVNRAAPSILRRRWRRQIAQGTPPWVRPANGLNEQLMDRAVDFVERNSYKGSSFYCDDCRASLDFVTTSLELERTFEDGRRAGVPIQEPYWDPQFQEFLYRVPPEMLQQGGRTKGLVREMLARRFPELGFERQKKVLADEFAKDIFITEIPETLRAMGGAQALADLGVVDAAKLDEEITRIATDPAERPRAYLIWHALSLESWARAHS